MRRQRKVILSMAALILCGSASILAVYNGSNDGTGHPAVGFVLGTKGADPCDYDNQAIGCSGVLIAPDVFLSTGNCTTAVTDSIASGFIDDGWVILDPSPLVPGAPEATLDCSKFVHIDSYDVNPSYLTTGAGDVGVMILAASQSITPATLPTLNRLSVKPKKNLPDITGVSFGELANPASPGGFDIFTLARRFAHAALLSRSIGAELHEARFDAAAGDDPCIGFLARGGPTFVTGQNEILSLARYPAATCDNTASFQRLDVPSVRGFLSNYVTMP